MNICNKFDENVKNNVINFDVIDLFAIIFDNVINESFVIHIVYKQHRYQLRI